MTLARRTIAILFHASATESRLPHYFITRLAEYWREDGHTVVFLFGVEEYVPADLVIVHVDLSVVPESYLEFARRYPIALNAQVRDIRKSTISSLRVHRGDAYDGAVIVKSNLNYAGAPERAAAEAAVRSGSWWQRLRKRFHEARALRLGSPLDYRIYASPRRVPRRYFAQPDLIVERFLPEIEHGMYCVRNFHFLGDHLSCIRRRGKHPIVNGATVLDREPVEPHPEIVALRRELGFDYGKFDYVVVDGRAVLLDVNKTVGWAGAQDTPERRAERRKEAEGLYAYFRG